MSEANLDTETIEAPIPQHTPGIIFNMMPQEEELQRSVSIKLGTSQDNDLKFDHPLGRLDSEMSNGEVSERSYQNSLKANMNAYALKTNKTPASQKEEQKIGRASAP